MKETPTTRKCFFVELFVPGTCPRCDHRFRRPNKDFILVMPKPRSAGGRKREPAVVVVQQRSYDVISCCHCGNITARIMIERKRLFDRTLAYAHLQQGKPFTAVWEGVAAGDDANQESHELYPLAFAEVARNSIAFLHLLATTHRPK